MLRFATDRNISVVGGASRLLSAFLKSVRVDELVTFSDNTWGYSSFYEKIGFTLITTGSPGYGYSKDSAPRRNRLEFQKHKITTPENKHLTEVEIMNQLGFHAVWDCGHSKWSMRPKNNLTTLR